MKIIPFENNSAQVIKETIKVLKDGGLVIFPSDTVYGLLVDATNEEAVKKLINFKNRPIGKAISVFAANLEMLEQQVIVNEEKRKILNKMLPGPFTIILESHHKVSSLLESEKGTLGIRIPDYQIVTDLVAAYEKPITATSANLGGRPPHYSVESLLNELPEYKKELIDLIVDAGKLPRNKPSTILDLTTPELKILRHGDIVWKNEQTFETDTPIQTRHLAKYILNKFVKQSAEKPTVIILEGDLGTGKTVFVKGIAEELGIEERIVSPTFVIYYEYKTDQKNYYKNLFHFDLYNITDPEEFNDLGLYDNLKKGNIFCMEWGDKSAEVFDLFKEKAEVLYVKISYIDEEKRKFEVRQM
jgi:L-threonylcarbamoyladenylate synthase